MIYCYCQIEILEQVVNFIQQVKNNFTCPYMRCANFSDHTVTFLVNKKGYLLAGVAVWPFEV